MQKHTIISIIT